MGSSVDATEPADGGRPRWWPGRLPGPAPPLRATSIALGDLTVTLPGTCACCGDLAAASLRELRPGHESALIVPYCSRCHFHASAISTRRFAVALSSVLAALTAMLAAPLAAGGMSLAAYLVVVALATSIPIAVGAVAWRRPRLGHTASGRAVFWRPGANGDLVCTQPAWADALARQAGVTPVPCRVREPVMARWAGLVAMVALAFSPLVHRALHPRVRLINLTEVRLSVQTDGSEAAILGPTSQESPRAGTEVRWLVGSRRLSAIDPTGVVLDAQSVELRPFKDHLYAPGAEGTCFWLERTRYGRVREGLAPRVVEPIGRGTGFWALEEPVDTWFSPNPASGGDTRSTGGELTALRHAPCLEAPGPVRALLSTGSADGLSPAAP